MGMKLSHLGLMAFHECSKTLNMTAAAAALGITQSALSQRLAALESDLEVTLFIRDARGLTLTPEGQRLLLHTQVSLDLEGELLQDLKGEEKEPGGTIRIAAYSSVARSLILPAISGSLRRYPNLLPDLQTYEMKDLPGVLTTARADFVFLDYELNRAGVLQTKVGDEEYVVIESSRYKSHPDVFLDHDPSDNITEEFFRHQSRKAAYRRAFLGDVYSIIDGVEEGLGRAIMSRHLVEDNRKVKVVSGFRAYKKPIVLHYFDRAYYPRAFKLIRDELAGSFR